MAYDPMTEVEDEALEIDEETFAELLGLRSRAKLALLPGVDPSVERARLSIVLNDLIDVLIAGVEANPTKRWVMAQFQRHLILVQDEDTECREHFAMEMESIMDVFGIERSDGLLAFYLQ